MCGGLRPAVFAVIHMSLRNTLKYRCLPPPLGGRRVRGAWNEKIKFFRDFAENICFFRFLGLNLWCFISNYCLIHIGN
jgi:hypothetical protein